MKKILFSALVLFSTFFGLAQATVIDSAAKAKEVPDTCLPFGCASGNGEFQQMYFAKNFDHEMFLDGLTFNLADTAHGPNLPSLSSGLFTITMSWVKGDGFPPANKKGTNSMVVFQGNLPSVQNWEEYHIDFSQSYFYDPATHYNLFMDVKWENAKAGTNPMMFTQTKANWSRPVPSKGSPQNPNHYGLDTEFCEVPEPGSLALLGLGMLGMGALRRRKN